MDANYSLIEDDEMSSTTDETDPHVDCDAGDQVIDLTFHVYLFISIFITIGLSFVIRRRHLWPDCYGGKPGFLQPLDFMDEIGRRWAYAACFVIIANDIIPMFIDESHFELIPNDDEEWMNKYGWVSVFHEFFEAMCICLVFYPLLACVDHRHYIAANVVGIIYLIPWICSYTTYFVICGTGKGFTGLANLLMRIPIYIAFFVVGVSYVLDLVRNCLRRIQDRRRRAAADKTFSTIDNTKQRMYKIGHHFEYVVNFLQQRSPEQIDETKSALKVTLKKLIKQVKYDKILGFRYSTRIVCCLTVSSTLLIWMMIFAAGVLELVIKWIIDGCAKVDDSHLESTFEMYCEHIIVTRIVVHVANVLAGLVIVGFFINTLIIYKRRWHQMLRGDHSWHMYGSSVIDDPQDTLLNGLEFAGCQAAYAAWGWVVLMVTISSLLMFLSYALIIPLKNGEQSWFIKMIWRLWPTVILGALISLAQKLICRYCFLQDKGSVMALDNRRVYNAVSYYFLVLNVIVGFFSCLKRILVPLVLGVTFLSRLDRPLIMSGYETEDPGYVSFVSMLLVDLYHNHPVGKTFAELLLKVREKREQQEQQKQDPQNPEQQKQLITDMSGENAALEDKKRLRSKMIRNRWLKTVTLVNNPSLAVKIIEKRLIDERRKAELIESLTRKFHQHILDYDGNLIETDSQSLEAQEMIKVKDDSVAIKLQPLNDNTAMTTVYKL